jgi:hypothetical protein
VTGELKTVEHDLIRRRYLKFFRLVAMATRVLHGMETTLLRLHTRNIPVKLLYGFRGDVVLKV